MLTNTATTWEHEERHDHVDSWLNDLGRIEDIQVSPDGEKVAALFVTKENESRICVDGTVWEQDYTRIWYPRFSPDNRMTALVFDDEAWTLIVDNKPWTSQFDYAWNTGFSRDGKHISLVVQNGGDYGVALDDQLWDPLFPGIGHMAMSPDGTKTAAVVQTERISEGDIFTFQKGVYSIAQEGKTWDATYVNVWDPTYSSDGNHVAAAVRLNLYDYTVSVDGKSWAHRYECIWKPRFQPGTSHVVAPVRINQKWTMARNGERYWKNSFMQLWHPEFSPDGSRLAAIVAPHFGTWSIAVDDKTWNLRHFDGITGLTFSPDGHRIAAVGRRKGKHTLIYDGTSCSHFCDRVWPPVFSPDGRHLAAKIQIDGRYTILLNGILWQADYDTVWDPVFDETGEYVMIRALDHGFYHKHVVPLSLFKKQSIH